MVVATATCRLPSRPSSLLLLLTVEGFRLVEDGLALRGVHDERDVVGLYGFLDLSHLLEQGVLLLVSPGSVYNDNLLCTPQKKL